MGPPTKRRRRRGGGIYRCDTPQSESGRGRLRRRRPSFVNTIDWRRDGDGERIMANQLRGMCPMHLPPPSQKAASHLISLAGEKEAVGPLGPTHTHAMSGAKMAGNGSSLSPAGLLKRGEEMFSKSHLTGLYGKAQGRNATYFATGRPRRSNPPFFCPPFG